MRPNRLRRFSFLAVFGVLVAAACLNAGIAKAEPAINATAVCAVLQQHPSIEGVTAILAEIVKETGADPNVAFRGVTVAVAMQCPQLFPAVKAFIDTYTAPPEYRQGYVA